MRNRDRGKNEEAPHRQRGVPQAEPAAGDVQAGPAPISDGDVTTHDRTKGKHRKQNANDPQHDARRRNGVLLWLRLGVARGRKHGFRAGGRCGVGRDIRFWLHGLPHTGYSSPSSDASSSAGSSSSSASPSSASESAGTQPSGAGIGSPATRRRSSSLRTSEKPEPSTMSTKGSVRVSITICASGMRSAMVYPTSRYSGPTRTFALPKYRSVALSTVSTLTPKAWMSSAVRAPRPLVLVEFSTFTEISLNSTGVAPSGGHGCVTTGGSVGSDDFSSSSKGGGTISAQTAPANSADPRSTATIDPKMTVCRCCIRFRRAARARAACCAGESFTGWPFAWSEETTPYCSRRVGKLPKFHSSNTRAWRTLR